MLVTYDYKMNGVWYSVQNEKELSNVLANPAIPLRVTIITEFGIVVMEC